MKPYLLFVLLLCFVEDISANTYYSVNNTNCNATSSWRTNRNGTGSSPSGFNASDIFIIQSNHQLTTSGNWNLSGSNAKLIVESNGVLTANHKVSVDIFQLYANATYIHNDNGASFPGSEQRLFDASSTVEIRDWSGNSELPETTWGNLIIDVGDFNNNMSQDGKLTQIAGDFIIKSTGKNNREFRLANKQDYTLEIGGDLVIEDGILEASSGNGSATQIIIINGSFYQSGGTFTRSNNNSALEVQFNGANSFFTKTGGSLTDNRMEWQVKSGKKLTLNSDMTASRSFTVDGTLDLGTKRLQGSGSFTLNASGKVITGNTSGLNAALNLTGTISLVNGASYQFTSYTSSPFPTTAGSIVASAFVVDAGVKLNKNLTVTGSLQLNSGNLTIPAGNTLTVTAPSVIVSSGFGLSKHFVTEVNTTSGAKGYVRIQNLSGVTNIPTGTGTYYLPVTLTVSGNNDFSICTFKGITTNGQPNGPAMTATQKKEFVDAVWVVNRNGGTNDVNMQVNWPESLEGSTFTNVGSSRIGIAHYGTYWEPSLGYGNQSGNTATRSAITNFSPFAVGIGDIPLPLVFGNISLSYSDDSVQIQWLSRAEHDVSYYTIERSTDGRVFNSIARVNSVGQGIPEATYTWSDPVHSNGLYYYRIKAVDIDAKVLYSPVKTINVFRGLNTPLTVFPNPSTNSNLQVSGYLAADKYTINVFDMRGRSVYTRTFNHSGGSITENIELPSNTTRGFYSVSVRGDLGSRFSKLVVINSGL